MGCLARSLNSLICAFAALTLVVSAGLAQAQGAGPVLEDGEAVVAGFSGARAPVLIAPGVDPAQNPVIDVDGPSARVIDLRALGGPPSGQVVAAAKPLTIPASLIGQVFAVALDAQTPPNAYLAATSAYGLPIVGPGAGGAVVRLKQGAPGATFMPGLFGPASQQGGPGSIWRVDGKTGETRLFANVSFGGLANSGPALGGLTFDAATQTLFAADRQTGMIHAFDINGAERAIYDHGVQGQSAAGLSTTPYDPALRLDITDPKFKTDDNSTWGLAPPARRVFGLAAHGGRLYYAVAEDMRIWSVGLTAAGGFGADARIELTVPPGVGDSEISKIAFDDQGRMLLAERPAPTGAYDFVILTNEDQGRVMRYASADSWLAVPDKYAIGFPLQLRNGNGGVALGYGYAASGVVDPKSCGGFLWTTGEELRVSSDPTISNRLMQGGPAVVNGLQGNGVDLVRPANVPPFVTYFIDYDDRFDDPDARGHLGDIAIYRLCAATAQQGLGAPSPVVTGQTTAGFGASAGITGSTPSNGGQGPWCPPGEQAGAGSVCCSAGKTPGADGQCHSACPPGSPKADDPVNLIACYVGLAPQNDPAKWNVAAAVCWDGSKPTGAGAGKPDMLLGQCPQPPNAACPVGAAWSQQPGFWSNATCVTTAAQQQCISQGQDVGFDGACYPDICPVGLSAFPVNQCCPLGTTPDPAHPGQCAAPGTGNNGTNNQGTNNQGTNNQGTNNQGTNNSGVNNGPWTFNPANPVLFCAGDQKPGLVCCREYEVYDVPTKQCRSLCPDGSIAVEREKACYFGYQPLAFGQTFSPASGTCLDGNPPQMVAIGGGNLSLTCPRPAAALCHFGYTLKPKAANAKGVWTDFTCEPSDPQKQCKSGEFVGVDGKCYDDILCGLGPNIGESWLPWPVCCEPGVTPGPSGLCAGSVFLPETITNAGKKLSVPKSGGPWDPGGSPPTSPGCAQGYALTAAGLCCLEGQLTATGLCCPPGQVPDAGRRACATATHGQIFFQSPHPTNRPPNNPVCVGGRWDPLRGACITDVSPPPVPPKGDCPPGGRWDPTRQMCMAASPRPSPLLQVCLGGWWDRHQGRCVVNRTPRAPTPTYTTVPIAPPSPHPWRAPRAPTPSYTRVPIAPPSPHPWRTPRAPHPWRTPIAPHPWHTPHAQPWGRAPTAQPRWHTPYTPSPLQVMPMR